MSFTVEDMYPLFAPKWMGGTHSQFPGVLDRVAQAGVERVPGAEDERPMPLAVAAPSGDPRAFDRQMMEAVPSTYPGDPRGYDTQMKESVPVPLTTQAQPQPVVIDQAGQNDPETDALAKALMNPGGRPFGTGGFGGWLGAAYQTPGGQNRWYHGKDIWSDF